MTMSRLLRKQWRKRPGRALATAASVAVAVAVGVDAAALVATGLLTLSAGIPCEAADEIILDAGLAAGLGKQLGDEVILFARRGVRRMQVVGIAESQSMKWFTEGGGVVVRIEPLEDMSNAFGLVDRVRVVLAAGTSRPAVLAAILKRLPAELAAEVPAGRAGMAEDVLHSANLGLDFVTGLTVAMAGFIVGNAMLRNVTERRRSFALLRVLGATVRQVERFVIVEAALLGLVGAIAGAALGRAAVPAGILMMLAFVATTPVVLPTISAACGRLIPKRWRIERTLAVEQIIRQPIRTALTTGVLVVAVSNGIGLGHAIRDNVDDVIGWYTRLMRADWMLTHAGMVSGGLDTAARRRA